MWLNRNPREDHLMPILFQSCLLIWCNSNTWTMGRLSFLQTCFPIIVPFLLKWHQRWYTTGKSSLTRSNYDGRFCLSPLPELSSCLSMHFMNVFPSSTLQHDHHSHQINVRHAKPYIRLTAISLIITVPAGKIFPSFLFTSSCHSLPWKYDVIAN